jgi:hypothetical protein
MHAEGTLQLAIRSVGGDTPLHGVTDNRVSA